MPPDDDIPLEFDDLTAVDEMDDYDASELTPVAKDPCLWCGAPVLRVTDNPNDVRPPLDVPDAAANWKTCVATQNGRWAWCPRASKGWTRVGMLKIDLDRRLPAV